MLRLYHHPQMNLLTLLPHQPFEPLAEAVLPAYPSQMLSANNLQDLTSGKNIILLPP